MTIKQVRTLPLCSYRAVQYYLYEDGKIVLEEDGNGTETARNVYGIYLLSRETADGDYTYRFNGHGDVIALTDSTGTVVASYYYDPFGVITEETGEVINPFRYVGEYYDEETGMVYLRARYYDPTIGRFISEDPIRDGYNWYVYCSNNPIRYVDPWGLVTTLLDVIRFTKSNPDKVDEWYNELGAAGSWEKIKEASAPNKPTNMIELDDSIIIYSYVSIEGDCAGRVLDELTGTTYGDATIQGVTETWSGHYGGKEIIPWLIDVSNIDASYNEPCIHVQIHKYSGRSHMVERKKADAQWIVNLYRWNKNDGAYNFEDFKLLAGHEFGHVYGIDDLYRDDDFKETYGIVPADSIMHTQKEALCAHPMDFAMLLFAQRNPRVKVYGWYEQREYLEELSLIKAKK